MSKHGDETRLRLIRAAEKLFEERGVDRVSMREIAVRAGEKNNSAAIYHFVTKAALVDAILERHSLPIQAAFPAEIEALQARGSVTLRDVLNVLVRPVAQKLNDPDGGRSYLAICAQLVVSTTFPLEQRGTAATPEIMLFGSAVAPFLPPLAPGLLALRMTRLAGSLYVSILQYDRLKAALDGLSYDDFMNELLDSLTGLVGA